MCFVFLKLRSSCRYLRKLSYCLAKTKEIIRSSYVHCVNIHTYNSSTTCTNPTTTANIISKLIFLHFFAHPKQIQTQTKFVFSPAVFRHWDDHLWTPFVPMVQMKFLNLQNMGLISYNPLKMKVMSSHGMYIYTSYLKFWICSRDTRCNPLWHLLQPIFQRPSGPTLRTTKWGSQSDEHLDTTPRSNMEA